MPHVADVSRRTVLGLIGLGSAMQTEASEQPQILRSPESPDLIAYMYKRNGKLHRDHDRPAFIVCSASTGTKLLEDWRQDGELHRALGPAMIWYRLDDGSVQSRTWFLRDRFIRQEAFDRS